MNVLFLQNRKVIYIYYKICYHTSGLNAYYCYAMYKLERDFDSTMACKTYVDCDEIVRFEIANKKFIIIL